MISSPFADRRSRDNSHARSSAPSAADVAGFQRKSTLLETLLTFCPPGPPLRANAIDSSLPGMVTRSVMTRSSTTRLRLRGLRLATLRRRRLRRLLVHADLGLGGG